MPINDDEVALGPAISDELGADVIGEIALVSAAGLAALDPEAATSFLGIDLAAGAHQKRTRRLAELTGTNVGPADRPPVIVNLHRVRHLSLYVAAAMGALTVIRLGHVLIVSVRRRRVDHAVLRALGATPRWVGGVVQWQASVTPVAGAVVALPVGIAAGQASYRSVASSVGVPDDASGALLALGVLLAPSVALANAVAALPARHSRRARPAGCCVRIDRPLWVRGSALGWL